MPAKSDKEIVFFLANVGKQPLDGDPDYVEKAKEVMKLITEKKLFLRPKDEIGIMLAGQTINDSVIDERRTAILQNNQVPSWDTVEEILRIKKTNKRFEDWPKALNEVLEYLTELMLVSRVILILLFDCNAICSGIDSVDPRAIAGRLQELDISLLWIGTKPLKDLPPEKLNKSERILMEVINKVNGEYMTMEKTLPTLRIFKKHKTHYMAWKCALEIGNIMIPTSTYVQATEDMKQPMFQTVNTLIENDVETRTIAKAEYIYTDRHRSEYPASETISGYMYGRKFIPVAEADEIGMATNPNSQCFEVFGFVPRDSVKLEDMSGDSSRIVIPDGPAAVKPFYCLVQAMIDIERVAIVRKVWRAKCDSKVYVLVPHTDVPGEPWCLIIIELLFAEDRRVLQSRPLNSIIKGLTKEKEDIVEDFIDSMMLTDADDKGDDLFAPGAVPSPGLQHLWNSLSYRALNPDVPVPPIDEKLKKLLEPPESIKIKREPLLKKLKELFPIEDTRDASTAPQDTSVPTPIPVITEIEKVESKIEESKNESISHPEESFVDLDELFDADMDI